MNLKFSANISSQLAASMVHRMYQLGSQAVKLRLHGEHVESQACVDHAMRLADYLLSKEGNDEGGELLMTMAV